jgi:hypothetical protein
MAVSKPARTTCPVAADSLRELKSRIAP